MHFIIYFLVPELKFFSKWIPLILLRNSRPEPFCQKAFSKNFEKFNRNNRNWLFFLSKVAGVSFSYTTSLLLLSENFSDNGKIIKITEVLLHLHFCSTDTAHSFYEDKSLISFVGFKNINY